VDFKEISLPWYKELLPPALRGDAKPESADDEEVWAPNRNGLLVAIAAAIADAKGIGSVIAGFNAEEAATFPDNSSRFIGVYNELLEISTKNPIVLDSYTVELDKTAIVKRAIGVEAPLEYVYSCYAPGRTMCGRCRSCERLITALDRNGVLTEYRNLFDSVEL
jgi:7-cyano-7-deazaguanine synthase